MSSSTATINYSTALEDATASSIQTNHNGFDNEETEPKAALSTRERSQSISHVNCILRSYVKGGISLMPH